MPTVFLFGYEMSIVDIITIGVSFILLVFTAIKTGSVKKIIKGVFKIMKYVFKTQQTVEPTKGQTFAETKPVYRLNKATGELEKTEDTVDLQEVINSCIDTALDRALDRLLPKVEQEQDVVSLALMREDLDFAMETCNRAEEYREKLGLSDKLSVEEVYSEVAKQAELLKVKIDTAEQVKKQVVKEEEVTKNEKKETIAQSE